MASSTRVTADDRRKRRNQEDETAKNGVGSSKQKGRRIGPKNPGQKKPPRRGMGVAQLERLCFLERLAKIPSSAAATANPVLISPPKNIFHDHRLPPQPTLPSFRVPLSGVPMQQQKYGPAIGGSPSVLNHQTGRSDDGFGSFHSWSGPATAGPTVASQGTKDPRPSLLCAVCFKTGTPVENASCVDTKIGVLTEYEFFPKNMNDNSHGHDHHQVITKLDRAPPPVYGNAASDNRSNTIDLSLRL